MANADPYYIAKGTVDEDARQAWIDRFSAEAAAEGCTHVRLSEGGGMLLLEGWLVRPEDEGAPRWE